MNIRAIINEFEKFSISIRETTDPVKENDIVRFETLFNATLPVEYKELLSYSNGISLMGDEILGIGESSLNMSLEQVYHIEHHLVGNPMPSFLIPFAPDGYGNHYCFHPHSCSIIFWQYDRSEAMNLADVVYHNLFEMIDEIFFKWTLEKFDYEGNYR